MTREEAITMLKKLRTFHNGTYAKPIDMAIEALSADGDLISKQRVINILRSICGPVCTINNDVVNEINALQSSERGSGEWAWIEPK